MSGLDRSFTPRKGWRVNYWRGFFWQLGGGHGGCNWNGQRYYQFRAPLLTVTVTTPILCWCWSGFEETEQGQVARRAARLARTRDFEYPYPPNRPF